MEQQKRPTADGNLDVEILVGIARNLRTTTAHEKIQVRTFVGLQNVLDVKPHPASFG